MKILVTYFSATATTKEIARMISKELKADLFEIEPVEKYTSADLNWMDQNSRSSKENADRKTLPAIKEYPKNLDEYDAILLGFPIWWYREPRIIDTFLENAKLENKTIVPFATSGGTDMDGINVTLKNEYPQLKFLNGERLTKNTVTFWANKIKEELSK